MTQSICYDQDDPFRRHRYYLIRICRKICASVWNREKIEEFVQNVLSIFRERTHENSKKLTRDDLSSLDEALCNAMAKELDSKNLLDCISLKDESDAAKFAADKCFELFDNRHRGALRTTVKMWCKKYRISDDLREDIIQEVFLIVYENAGNFEAEPDKIGKFDKLQTQVQAWLGGIALNKVRHIQRTKSKEINIGDMINPEQGDDIRVEDILDGILKKTKRLVDRMLEAEENAYGVTPETESEPEGDELTKSRMLEMLKKCADKVLKERERDILYAAVTYYTNEKERIKAMKELEDKHTISADNRRTILKRSLEKIKKCLDKQK